MVSIARRCFAGLILAVWSCGSAVADVELFAADRLVDAVERNDPDAVSGMLARGVNPNAVDANYRTGLMIAANVGNDTMVKLLLKYRANPNTPDLLGNTALSYASLQGHAEVIVLLIAGHANPNAENKQGLTPLMQAASAGYVDAVQVLLERKADADRRDFTGRTALMWAERGRKNAVIQALRRAGVRE
jgi:ankyrin repeat protein